MNHFLGEVANLRTLSMNCLISFVKYALNGSFTYLTDSIRWLKDPRSLSQRSQVNSSLKGYFWENNILKFSLFSQIVRLQKTDHILRHCAVILHPFWFIQMRGDKSNQLQSHKTDRLHRNIKHFPSNKFVNVQIWVHTSVIRINRQKGE